MFLTWLYLLLRSWLRRRRSGRSIRRRATLNPPASKVRNQRKPAWVRHEVLRLKALCPGLGCRSIAACFNRMHRRRGESVSKSYVAALLRLEHVQVLRLRRLLKHRVPQPMPANRIWALDLTGKADLSGRQHVILGLIDHGSRACLRLRALRSKSSLAILSELGAAFRAYGLPAWLRVDNEACLNSSLIRTVLAALGVRLHNTDPHCPWQNGRIERLFGTLKQSLDLIAVCNGADLAHRLGEFRAWYNHVRPHQQLFGLTPAEVWSGLDASCNEPLWLSAWDGLLSGWFFPP